MKKSKATIWAKDGEFGIRPIGSVEEAQIFLEGWPAMDRSPLYYVATNSIEAAEAGSISPDEAKEMLVEFLNDAGALAEEKL
jgi:hypothetical protein